MTVANKLYRLSEILKLLRLGRPNVDSLATTFSVCRRTVMRDVEDLRGLGFVIDYNSKLQQYILMGPKMIVETRFSLDEALALIALCFDMGEDIPFLSGARTAALKLESALPKPIMMEVQQRYHSLLIQPPKVNPLAGVEGLFDLILGAIRLSKAVRLSYRSPAEPEFMTLLHPYHLFFGRHSWYVIGRSSLHRETRMFHLGRITTMEITDQEFKVPKGFTLKHFFGNAWAMIREPGPDRDVVVRFSPLVAKNVSEVAWHATQRLLWNTDGSLDYHVTVSGLNEISWWILGYGKEAEVLEPPKLREMIRGHAVAMLERYG